MSLIYIKHPNESCNIQQELFLSSCNEELKSYHTLMFNHGNATYRYHQIEPTEDDYRDWLAGLPENIKNSFTKMGYEKSKTALPLKRFANEIRDNGMAEYLKKLLKPDDYQAFQKMQMDV